MKYFLTISLLSLSLNGCNTTPYKCQDAEEFFLKNDGKASIPGTKNYTNLDLALHIEERKKDYENFVDFHLSKKGLKKDQINFHDSFCKAMFDLNNIPDEVLKNNKKKNYRRYLLKKYEERIRKNTDVIEVDGCSDIAELVSEEYVENFAKQNKTEIFLLSKQSYQSCLNEHYVPEEVTNED